MNVQTTVFGLIGGLALFLYGMNLTSAGLRGMGSESFKRIMHTLTRNRPTAILVGMGVTCLIQSSSATSVMAVGFVNAGLLAMDQAVAVVLGADIGTTITAWIVSATGIEKINIADYSLPLVALGFLINFVAKQRKRKMLGQVILGFGLLFLGLGTMSMGVREFRESDALREFFALHCDNPFLGILAGTVVTMVIQSSSATIAIVQLMAFQNLFGLEVALPLMVGANIGTTITAQLAAIGGSKRARGLAMANTAFKVLTAAAMVPLLTTGLWEDAIRFILPDTSGSGGVRVMLQIAIAHTTFIALGVVLFSSALWKPLIKIARWTARMRDDMTGQIDRLDPLLLETPPFAIELTTRELTKMVHLCRENLRAAFRAFTERDLSQSHAISERESAIDQMQERITSYLVALSQRDLAVKVSAAIPELIHAINDAERIGDHAENLVELAQQRISGGVELSADGMGELREYFELLDRQFATTLEALEAGSRKAVNTALVLEGQVNAEHDRLTQCHISRLESGTCTVQAGILFVEMLINLEKVGDHLTNIAERTEVGES